VAPDDGDVHTRDLIRPAQLTANQQFVADPEVREIFKEGGFQGLPQMVESAGEAET
jgi:hypothetical protein